MSTNPSITRAMILGAGLGKRMRPLTNDRPKPLIEVAGRTMLDRSLDALADSGITDVVINIHYLADKIEAHLRGRPTPPHTHISDERDRLLDTGGGITKALPLLGPDPFIGINGDAVWTDGDARTLQRLMAHFDPERMDGLLLLVRTDQAIGFQGPGDFFLQDDGRLRWRGDAAASPWIYGGIQILHPRAFDGAPVQPFSLITIYRQALEKGRLYGLAHRGHWAHVGTPDAIALAEQMLQANPPTAKGRDRP